MAIEIQGPAGRAPADVKESSSGSANKSQSGTSDAAGVLPASSSSDRFSLTDQAAVIRSLEHQVANLPVIDTKRVTDVQQTIATGDFRINPESVAEKLLRFEADMPN